MLTALGILTGSLFVALASSEHSNRCVQNLGGILPCSEISLTGGGLYQSLRSCCNGVRAIAKDRCECNPLIKGLLGKEGAAVFKLEPVCRILQPVQWATIPARLVRSCSAILSINDYVCEKSDVEIDAARFESLDSFNALFLNNDDEAICFDTNRFKRGLGQSFREDASFYVPYGAGNYTGLEDIAEYLGIPFASLTHGYWQNNVTRSEDRSKKARFELSADGRTWTLGSTLSPGTFLRGADPYQEYYAEQEVIFDGCETKIKQYNIVPTDGLMIQILIRFVQTASFSKRYGIEDICRYHTKFCSSDPVTRQYSTEKECLDYMRSLPLYTEMCGKNRPFSGRSFPCKWKHHLMIPTNPPLHCPHIGKAGVADINGNFKCDDAAECTKDEGQDEWPPLRDVGAETPAERLQLYAENDIGYEDEPFGCATRSNVG